MLDGITDILKIFDSMVYETNFMPDCDEEGNLIQSKELASQYKKRFIERVERGEIMRYSMHYPITGYKELDDFFKNRLTKEVDRLNKEYYEREKYIKLKQCM